MKASTTHTRFLRLSEVTQRTSIGKSSIYQKISQGTFPEQVHVTARSARWIEAEIDTWIQEQISRSRSADVSGPGQRFRKMENPSPQSDCGLQPDGGQQ
jgi:prophage regulatory protein